MLVKRRNQLNNNTNKSLFQFINTSSSVDINTSSGQMYEKRHVAML